VESSPIVPAQRFVLRTPLLPFGELTALAGDRAGAQLRLRALVERPEVAEALYLASPSLVDSIGIWRAAPDSARGRKIERALVKYVARMAGRATPFGLFSGISVGRFAARTRLALGPAAAHGRRTRIDNDYLFGLAAELVSDGEARAGYRFFANSGLSRLGGRFRYPEARLSGSDRSYHLVSVEPTSYLEATLARAEHGATPAELAAGLMADDPEVSREEADTYVGALIEAQVLVGELGVQVTGPEPLDRFVELAGGETAGVLSDVRARLVALDAGGLGAAVAIYEEVAARLRPLRTVESLDRNRLFQVDMLTAAPELELPASVAAEVARGVGLLRAVGVASSDASLAEFRQAFAARYEDREVPLAEALDEESGIGFESGLVPGAEGSPLLARLRFPAQVAEREARWGARQRELLRLLLSGAPAIELDDRVIAAMKPPELPRVPAAFAVMTRIAAASPEAVDRGDFRVLVDGFSGPSGARLLGRFCALSAEVDDVVRAHVAAEERLHPEALFAEIVHLNEGRIGNIQCRPVLRSYEIPYLGHSGSPPDARIVVDDLMVSVRGDRIVLRSRARDREVVPRLSTAHNYRLRSLPIYRFLCALQSQDGGGAGWSWGPLEAAPFLPRVTAGRVVLARARWLLSAAELEGVVKAARAESRASSETLEACRARSAELVADLRRTRSLPRFVVIADGDNELPVDFESSLGVDVVIHHARAGQALELYEQFPAPDELAVSGPDGSFVSELVMLFTAGNAGRAQRFDRAGPAIQRSFAPGSEWLYAKLYTGPAVADRVLREAVAPVVRELLGRGLAGGWFFLRYADPDHHLRVRFRGDPEALTGVALPALHAALAPLLGDGSVWKVQLDTYQRELERYGGADCIELAEQLFAIDSDATLDIVDLLEGDEGKDARWRVAVRGADDLLIALGLDPAERLSSYTAARDAFAAEFGIDTDFQRQLGAIYRTERADLAQLLRPGGVDTDHWLAPGFQVLEARADRLREPARELAARLGPRTADVGRSLIHMHLNRMLHASQRAQELVIYDLLRRHCRSAQARR
jgi:thiopeptide-type bacteriocin biosynthesis protein